MSVTHIATVYIKLLFFSFLYGVYSLISSSGTSSSKANLSRFDRCWRLPYIVLSRSSHAIPLGRLKRASSRKRPFAYPHGFGIQTSATTSGIGSHLTQRRQDMNGMIMPVCQIEVIFIRISGIFWVLYKYTRVGITESSLITDPILINISVFVTINTCNDIGAVKASPLKSERRI